MRLVDVVLGTVRSLRAHALRFGLASLGIVWGLAMLTYVVASMDGFEEHWERSTQKIGARLVIALPGAVTKEGVGHRAARPVELELEDVERISRLRAVEAAAPSKELGQLILRARPTGSSRSRTKLVPTFGVSSQTARIRRYEVEHGRFLSHDDVEHSARVAFLGAVAAERLFGRVPAVGRTVHIESVPFRVVGVAKAKGWQNVNFGARDDDRALIPITAALRWFADSERLDMIVFSSRTSEGSWDAIRYVRALLGRHHGFGADQESALQSFNLEDILILIRTLALGMRIFFTVAAVITLLVGAVGVMNIMLVVVRERTREIGLRKAVGASNAAIFVQFLAETLAVALSSGLVGAALGWLAVQADAAGTDTSDFVHVPVLLPATLLQISLVMVGVGVAAGLIPAVRASRVEPAEALRAT